MGKARLEGGNPFKIINAYIEEYKAYTDDIRPGTFVEFVSASESSYKHVSRLIFQSVTTSNYDEMKCVVLDDTHAMVVIDTGENTTSNVNALILTFNLSRKTITYGKSTTIGYGLYTTGDTFDIVKIDSTRVLYVGSSAYSNTYNYKAYACVLYLYETSVVVGNIVYMGENMLSFNRDIHVCEIPNENRYLVCSSSVYTVLSVDNNTVSISSDNTQLSLPISAYKVYGIMAIDSTNFIMLVISSETNNPLYAIFITRNSNTFTPGTATKISDKWNDLQYQLEPMFIDNTHIILGYTKGATYDTDTHYLYIIDISNNVCTLASSYSMNGNGGLRAFFDGRACFYSDTRILYIVSNTSIKPIVAIKIDDDYSMKLYDTFDSDVYAYANTNAHMLQIPNTPYALLVGSAYSNDSVYATSVLNLSKMQKYVKPYDTKVDGITTTPCKTSKAGKVAIPTKGV